MSDSSTTTRTVAWRRADGSGLELASIESSPSELAITGAVVLVHDDVAWEIRYRLEVDEEGRTRAARVDWSADDATGRLTLAVDDDGHWSRDGAPSPELDGAFDVDLGFSPSTNTLPIRRLALADGESASLVAAWVRFPDLDVIPLEQSYERVDARHYRYRSETGFERVIEVDPDGIVADYPGVWTRVDAK